MMRVPTALLLVLLWVVLTGSVSVPNLILGVAISLFTLYLLRGQIGSLSGRFRPLALLLLAALFARELALSAWQVMRLVLSPKMDLKPGVFAYPLTAERDFEIMLLANLITLTPGTLSVDVSDDRKTLYVHALDCSEPERLRRNIGEGFERRILEAFR